MKQTTKLIMYILMIYVVNWICVNIIAQHITAFAQYVKNTYHKLKKNTPCWKALCIRKAFTLIEITRRKKSGGFRSYKYQCERPVVVYADTKCALHNFINQMLCIIMKTCLHVFNCFKYDRNMNGYWDDVGAGCIIQMTLEKKYS